MIPMVMQKVADAAGRGAGQYEDPHALGSFAVWTGFARSGSGTVTENGSLRVMGCPRPPGRPRVATVMRYRQLQALCLTATPGKFSKPPAWDVTTAKS